MIRSERLFVVTDKESGIAGFRAKLGSHHRSKDGVHLFVDEDFDQDFIGIEHGIGKIVARRDPGFELVVSPRWNVDTLTCDLFVDETVLEPCSVSARILEPFLFDEKTC